MEARLTMTGSNPKKQLKNTCGLTTAKQAYKTQESETGWGPLTRLAFLEASAAL